MITNYLISHQAVLNACASAFKELNIKGDNAQYLLDKLDTIFERRSIEPYLNERIACTAFKEIYKFGDKHIIKFCAIDNETEEEIDMAYNAAEIGIGDIIAPTYYIPIPAGCKIKLERLTQYDKFYSGCYLRPYYADYMIIQPVAQVPTLEDCTWLNYPNYIRSPLMDGNKPIPYDEVKDIDCFIESMEWLQAIIDSYGKDFFDKVVRFLYTYHIDFLTISDIGYINDKPVILSALA